MLRIAEVLQKGNQMEKVLSAKEAAKVLGVGHHTIQKLLETGKLKGFKIGNRWKIPERFLDKYILESAVTEAKERTHEQC